MSQLIRSQREKSLIFPSSRGRKRANSDNKVNISGAMPQRNNGVPVGSKIGLLTGALMSSPAQADVD